jgi:inhibitor of the pro-sigma K processing machinery
MMLEAGVILAGVLVLIVLLVITRLIMGPLKHVSRLILNCAIAITALLLLNLIGGYIGFHLPMNPVSVAGVTILGVPGLLLLSAMSFLLL